MEKPKKYHFEKLTPHDSSDISVYESALDFVFENDDIQNVAISGAYGAGKSSVLLSYQRTHTGEKAHGFCYISLAHFMSEKVVEHELDANKPGEISNNEDNILEGKILNQLIHQIPQDKIPQTNFRLKKSFDNKQLIKMILFIAVFILVCLHAIKFSEWSVFVLSLPLGCIRNILHYTIHPYTRMISGISSFVFAMYLLYQIVKMQKNKNLFRKLSIQGNEIEIFEESSDSYFDKYLNEVLYLFENVDADVIVFEDMDRFGSNRIFERLREVNALANMQRTKKGNTHVLRFFYLLRDDMFVSKDRTKFFDYIIPIVPVVDGSNSYNQFITHFKKNNLFDKFDESFLQGISLYVDDMRLLKNICNEFLVYFNRLNTTELDYNKMLAIITYKNLFPRDFSKLQLNRGFVFALFNNKVEFMQEEYRASEKKIDELKHRMDMAEKEIALSKSELELIFDRRRNSYRRLNEKDQAEYNERLQAISDRSLNVYSSIEDEIAALNTELQRIKAPSLAEIITRENIDHIFSLTTTNEIGVIDEYHDVKGSEYFDLVKYLIRNGYIDETYPDYMTYFYEDSLSRIDKVFLRSVSDRKAKEYSYKLDSPAKVFQRLRPLDFDQEETLNFDLCDFLLRCKNGSEHLHHLIDQLQKGNKYAFVAQLFERTQYVEQFVNMFNKQWPDLFAEMQAEAEFSDVQKKMYSLYTLYYCDEETIIAVNKDNVLSDYISYSKDYLEIDNPQIDKLIHRFMLLSVLFQSIDYEKANKELSKTVYENDLYVLNFENIRLILIYYMRVSNLDEVKYRSYSTIYTDPLSPIYNRVECDFSKYFEVMIRACEGRILDDEEAAIFLLNRTDIDTNQKQRYIECLRTQITSLKALTDHDIWEHQMKHGELLCSEENIMEYFSYKGELDETLISFINNSVEELDFSKDHTEFTDEQREALWDQVITCEQLCNSKYVQILMTLGFHYTEFDIRGISDSKMKNLIDNDIVRMMPKTLEFIRNVYQSVLHYFIRMNIAVYMDIMTSELMVHSELVDILDWNISDEIRLKLLGFDNEAISIINKEYSTEIQSYILQHNLEEDDLVSLYSSYENLPSEIRMVVESYAKERIDDVIASETHISQLLVKDLLEQPDISTEKKLELILTVMPNVSLQKACDYLSVIGFGEYQKILDPRSRPKFNIDDQNTEILDAFVKEKWIYDYFEDESKEGYYKIRRREPRKADSHSLQIPC